MSDFLKYPLSDRIVALKKKIKKQLMVKGSTSRTLKVAVLGGSTTSEVCALLELFLLKQGFSVVFYESAYNRFYEEAVYGGALEAFAPDVIYVHTNYFNITQFPSGHSTPDEVNAMLDQEYEHFRQVWKALTKYNCPVIQNNFELPPDRWLGNLGFSDFRGDVNFITRLNAKFAEFSAQQPNFYINDIHYLSARLGLDHWYDLALYHSSKYALSFTAMPELTHSVSLIIGAVLGVSKKCLVLDLDNTCWGGIIGDDGAAGIRLGNDSAEGEAYSYFQRYLKKLHSRGVILSVCSKNELSLAKAGFSRSDSVLSLGDFSSFQANWEPKNFNIYTISSELNIGLDSMVFVDDNPAERQLVREAYDQVAVPDVGSDVTFFIKYLDRNGFFEATFLSQEDLVRNKAYADNVKRSTDQTAFLSYDDFLASLQMVAQIHRVNDENQERVFQLINKTNQFNMAASRVQVGDFSTLIASSSTLAICGRLLDKYGDNGIVSAMISRVISVDEVSIDIWVMSCRVFKRGLEFALFNQLVALCRQRGILTIYGSYIPTEKNGVVKDLYRQLGFSVAGEKDGAILWKYVIDDCYTPMSVQMEVQCE